MMIRDRIPLFVVGGSNQNFDLDPEHTQDLPTELEIPNLISVAPVDENDQFPSDGLASYGEQVYDIAAPGRGMPVLAASTIVLPSDPEGDLFACDGLWTVDGQTHKTGGSSFAAPQVAGVAVLVMAKALADNNVFLNATTVRQRILDNADSLPDLAFKRVAFGRRLNACKAVFDGPCPQ